MPNDPATVAGLRGRWRASTISSPPADGATLQTWTDTSGNANDAVQATAGFRPVYRSSGAFLPNSKPVVEFTTATSQRVQATVAQNTAATRFMVVYLKSLAADQTLSSSLLQMQVSTAGILRAAVENVAFVNNNGTTVLAINTWYVLTVSDNASNSDISYINGTADGSGTTTHTLTGTSLFIGGEYTGGEYASCYIAEVLDYSTVLSSTDRATVHSYAQEEYGVTVSDYAPAAGSLEAGPATNIHRSGRRSSI
jgi:hypothetical protein